jgi:hypothetical protein
MGSSWEICAARPMWSQGFGTYIPASAAAAARGKGFYDRRVEAPRPATSASRGEAYVPAIELPSKPSLSAPSYRHVIRPSTEPRICRVAISPGVNILERRLGEVRREVLPYAPVSSAGRGMSAACTSNDPTVFLPNHKYGRAQVSCDAHGKWPSAGKID